MSDSLYVPDMVLLHHAQAPDTRQFLEKADEEEKTNTLFSTLRYIYVTLLNAPYSNLAEPREFPLVTGSCERQNLKTIPQRSPCQLFRMFYGGKFKDVFTLNTLRKRLLAKKCVEK